MLSFFSKKEIIANVKTLSENSLPFLLEITYLFTALHFLIGYVLYFTNINEKEGKEILTRSLVTFIALFIFFNPLISNLVHSLDLSLLEERSTLTNNSAKMLSFLMTLIWLVNLMLFIAAFSSLLALLFYLGSYLLYPNNRKINYIIKASVGISLIIFPLSWQFPTFPTI